MHPRVVVRRLSVFRCVGSFFAYMWGEKKGIIVLSARGTTQIRGGVGRTLRSCLPRPTEILLPGGDVLRDLFHWCGT